MHFPKFYAFFPLIYMIYTILSIFEKMVGNRKEFVIQ